MNVCMITKFPPIQGGMSSTAYWLARGLAEDGVDVTVLTNSNIVERDYCITGAEFDNDSNLDVKCIDISDQFIIPRRSYDLISFFDKFWKIYKNKKIDVIDAHYLVPYGIVAYVLHKITGIPYILRHGGSDVEKFLKRGVYDDLFADVIENAACVNTIDKYVQSLSPHYEEFPMFIPNEKLFNEKNRKEIHEGDKIRIAYIGKVLRLYDDRDLTSIVNAFRPLKDKVSLIFLAQGAGMEDFKANVDTSFVEFQDFIPPWRMPEFYKTIDYVVYHVNKNPIPDWSNVVLEAFMSGVKVLTDNKKFFNSFTPFFGNIMDRILEVDLESGGDKIYSQLLDDMGFHNPMDKTFFEKVEDKVVGVIKDTIDSFNEADPCQNFDFEKKQGLKYNYLEYIRQNEKFYMDAIARAKH